MKKQWKRANGTGTVYKLNGHRRRPFAAMITTECRYDTATDQYLQTRKAIGYYASRDEAERALLDYLSEPYDLNTLNISFSELYDSWSKEHFDSISPSAVRTWKSAYAHLQPLHGKIFREIRSHMIESCISEYDGHSSTKQRMKSLCNLLYKYAIKMGYIHINYAALCDPIKNDPPMIERKPFSEEEIERLWANPSIPYVDLVLIGIYSGWRPQELITLKTTDIHPEEGYMIGGMKTAAGTGRIVPIHSRIRPFIEQHLELARSEGSPYLFTLYTRQGGTTVRADNTYFIYRNRFRRLMNTLGLSHRPHDTRHTFVTLAKDACMDEYVLKLIVGHSIRDLTERVYTHRTLRILMEEMEKIR